MGNQYSAVPEEKNKVEHYTEEQNFLMSKFFICEFLTKDDTSVVVSIPFNRTRLIIKSFEINPSGNDEAMFKAMKEAIDFTEHKFIPKLRELFTFEDK